MTPHSQHIPYQTSIIYLMCSNNIWKAEKHIKADHFLNILSDIQVILPFFFSFSNTDNQTPSLAIIQKKVQK